MRACFLSAAGDPFISLLAIKLWQERWYDEVDKMYVSYNNHAKVPQEVVEEVLSKFSRDTKIHIIYHPEGIGNGVPITEMIKISTEENIMLLEDDGYIFTPGVVDRNFKLLESGETDIIGSPRRSCGGEIWDESQRKYNLDYTGYGDVGPNWWPNFFFCKRSDILKTDMNFGSVEFKLGQYCQQLDYTFKETNYGDTMVWMCMQLRALNLRSTSVPQFHASPTEINDIEKKEMNWWKEQPYWIHGGSLSSGWNGYLNRLLPDVSTDLAKQEIETRVAFWTIAASVIDGFTDFKYVYQKGIDDLINNVGLDRDRIGKKIGIYRSLMRI